MKKIVLEIFLGFCEALRPLFGSRGICFYPEETCLQYTRRQFLTQSLFIASSKSICRIASCNPLYAWYKNSNEATRRKSSV